MGQPAILQDRFGRTIEYLRVSVTDRCDLRCTYCMPKGFKGFQEPANWLTFDELIRVVQIFAALGTKKIRLTGGEPLLRRGLSLLAARIREVPEIDDLSLSTNGTQLVQHAQFLRQAGVTRLNVSLDSLNHETFARIVGRDCLQQVLDGLMAAKANGFAPIKINFVAMRGVNDNEIDAVIDFCMTHGFVLRLIEAMPVGDTGRATEYLDLQPVRARIQKRFSLVDGLVAGGGPARYLQTADGSFSIGFITPISQHFCASCNRVRLTVDGILYTCLGQEHHVALRPLLRNNATDTELKSAILAGIDAKPERHEFREEPKKIIRFMSATGG